MTVGELMNRLDALDSDMEVMIEVGIYCAYVEYREVMTVEVIDLTSEQKVVELFASLEESHLDKR